MPTAQASILPAGTAAPEFSLQVAPGRMLRLEQHRGKPVVLVFYPGDWSPVCGDQLALYNEIYSEVTRHEAQLVGISVDSAGCHAGYDINSKRESNHLAACETTGVGRWP